MNGLANAQRAYDRACPADDRTDAQIEADAAERAQEARKAAALAAMPPRDDALWERVTAARLARNQHVAPVMRNLLNTMFYTA